ncbi:MAG: hypothetical protein K9K67_03935 [Bacteriovoracaceae bacterium]|nr:hypothetical protein [Bacteriovoracaceae bacterium]
MKDRNSQLENIVRFPTGGRQRPSPDIQATDDPLESLLNEFEEISRELDEGLYENVTIPVTKALESLPAVTTQRLLPEDILAEEFSKAMEFQTRINLLHEVNKRIKFYLDEVEQFVPKK